MSGAHVFIDRSQFPENVRRDLIESLRTRVINHKFHYESYKQAAKWLALHEAHSPARNNPSGVQIYDEAFQATLSATEHDRRCLHVIGLGCGGGQKEARLLETLRRAGHEVGYTASDVSLPLVLAARSAAIQFLEETRCGAVVCDLATADLGTIFKEPEREGRIVTLFGIVPNFEPGPLFSQITRLLCLDDFLLLSANLAPGSDYTAGTRAILPQYDNQWTRDWLFTFLSDLGFHLEDGEFEFTIETDEQRLHRIAANFVLKQSRDILVLDQRLRFNQGERIRLFFSYRHTPQTIRLVMQDHRIVMEKEWVNDTGEEGVFLCRKSG